MIRKLSREDRTETAASARRWVTDRELAAHYGVARQTIHNWVKKGFIRPPTKFGKRTARWDLDAVEQDFLAGDKQQP